VAVTDCKILHLKEYIFEKCKNTVPEGEYIPTLFSILIDFSAHLQVDVDLSGMNNNAVINLHVKGKPLGHNLNIGKSSPPINVSKSLCNFPRVRSFP
jgi:hypothetical protein